MKSSQTGQVCEEVSRAFALHLPTMGLDEKEDSGMGAGKGTGKGKKGTHHIQMSSAV